MVTYTCPQCKTQYEARVSNFGASYWFPQESSFKAIVLLNENELCRTCIDKIEAAKKEEIPDSEKPRAVEETI